MADSRMKKRKNKRNQRSPEEENCKKKRKLISSEEESETRSNTQRISISEPGREEQRQAKVEEEEAGKSVHRERNQDLKEGCPWRNLQLILTIQDKNIELEKSIEYYTYKSMAILPPKELSRRKGCHRLINAAETQCSIDVGLQHTIDTINFIFKFVECATVVMVFNCRKVELAFDFVMSMMKGEDGGASDCETVKFSRLIAFLNDWVQSLLVSPKKKISGGGKKSQDDVIETYLDFRCWRVFKFCLEESFKFHVSLSFSRNLLRSICFIAKNVLSLLENISSVSKVNFDGADFELHSVSLDCISLVFSSHCGLSNENLELWVTTANVVLELVLKIFAENLATSNVGIYVLRFSCLVFEPFAKFLRVHPTRKTGFRDFIDKLLEPLLHLLGILHLWINECNSCLTGELLKLVQDVLSYGLFHPVHVDGFLSLHSTEKYVASENVESKESKTFIRSYHRHLFDKLERVIAEKDFVACSMGQLFSLLVDCVKKLRGGSMMSENTKMVGKTEGSRHAGDTSFGHASKMFSESGISTLEKSYSTISLNEERRKSLFDFFVLLMEPLLLEISGYLEARVENQPSFLGVHCTLKSINSLLASFMHEKIYLRTEDTSEGALIFLKKVYTTTISLISDLISSFKYNADNNTEMKLLVLLLKEAFIAIGYLLEIEYNVMENDLINLWLMSFSCIAIELYWIDAPGKCSLFSVIADTGCHLLNLYSQLRQVTTAMFTLCKAVRLVHSRNGDSEMNYVRFLTNLPHEAYAKSVGMLICLQRFKQVIHKAVQSMPEGQAGGCLQQLATDITESLEWLRVSSSNADEENDGELNIQSNLVHFNLCAELLGRALSEVYALLLESLTVTTGNCILVGTSIKDLINLLRPYIGNLVGLESDAVNNFICSVSRNVFDIGLPSSSNDLQSSGSLSHWIFLFFFRMYMSCRSSFKQATSIMPPNSSRKMLAEMGDSLIMYSGWDVLQMTKWSDGGYFSWIVNPSASLLDVIQSILNIYEQESGADFFPLLYVMHAMALQRLVDLNKNIKSFEYLLQNNNNLLQAGLLDEAALSSYRKKSKKLDVLVLRQEATSLTKFLMRHLSIVDNDKQRISIIDTIGEAISTFESAEWDMNVSALNKNSFPAAIWWIICQNIDIWCTHAVKKKLKMFLSLLIRTSLPCGASGLLEIGKQSSDESNQLNRVNVYQISSELFYDSILYEQNFFCRHMASRFCHALEEYALLCISNYSGNFDLKSSPNWSEVLSSIENSSGVVSSNNQIMYNCFSGGKLNTHSSEESKVLPASCMKFTTCRGLLDLLSGLPKGHLNFKSVSLLLKSILNLERFIIGDLLDCQSTLDIHRSYELVRLFLSCRRSLKCILLAFFEENTEASQATLCQVLFDSSLPFVWLFKSVEVVVGIQLILRKYGSTQVDDVVFSLMDHTLYGFLTLNKFQFSHAVCYLQSSQKPCKQQENCKDAHEESNSVESDPLFDSSRFLQPWKSVFLVAKSLREQMQKLLISLKDALCYEKLNAGAYDLNLNKFSSLVSCFGGFMWGLASVMKQRDGRNSDDKLKPSRWKYEPFSEINHCINDFMELSRNLLQMLLFEDKHGSSLYNAQHHHSSTLKVFNKDSLVSEMLSDKGIYVDADISLGKHQCSDIHNDPEIGVHSKKLNLGDKKCDSNNLFDPSEMQPLDKPLLQSFLKGNHPEAAFLLRQLFIAFSAIMRLNLHINAAPLSSSLVQTFTGISEILLLELVDMHQVPQSFSFACLDGILKFLEELGNHFPSTNPTSSRNLYVKLVQLQLSAIGKCIAFQGKRATLLSHETESTIKMLHGHIDIAEVSFFSQPYCLDEFKARLRSSFAVFVNKPSELHLLSAIQAIERALVGVREKCTMISDIHTGQADGGMVSLNVAAGVDCLDLVLEFVSGHKRLGVVKRHIQSLLAGLFNVIIHLQSPSIFYGRLVYGKSDTDPDPGAVVLMCVEVLIRISGKYALFQMEAWHVAQSLCIPAELFQDFHHLKLSKAFVPNGYSTISSNHSCHPVASMQLCGVDKHFSISLFCACCRLLYTILKHHKSECERCIAILEASISILLHCLETVDAKSAATNDYFFWEVEEGVKCASSLRRIYEEIRHQKDVFSSHCSQILSSYIWVYSGYGPLRTGIKREIDEALRPGIYALIDVCSADDLQHLHTVFGEGPCRNTLATLQHDYKLNFQYGGKV